MMDEPHGRGPLPKADGALAGSGDRQSSLAEADRQRILHEWNDTRADFPEACVHQLFERQVERSPDATAVVCGERRLTYREVNARANRLAHDLRARGVGRETLVGVCLPRTPDLVVALLGVWKAGGAYVPLDPSYPEERLSFMVVDAAVHLLVTSESLRTLFPTVQEKQLCIDTDWPIIERHSAWNPEPRCAPSDLSYVMYTSGSTGKPKGAMIEHRGLVNYLWWAVRFYGVRAGGSVPVHTSVSFDLTVTSLYPALLAGAHVELLAEDRGAQGLADMLRRRADLDLVKITPAHLELMSQLLRPDELAGATRAFVIGGENLLAEHLRIWRERAPATRLINEYGPTETVVGCCVHDVLPGDPQDGSVPIGRPIANTQLYVLDGDMQPLPAGAVGELYIGGAGVGRGYLNRAQLTAERFVGNPFSSDPRERLYRSGDLARYRSDGVLEYLGRMDNQVKIRGYRIEPAEIEQALAAHPAVQSCAVLAREDTPGNRQLVAYAIARAGVPVGSEALHAFLAARLPEYMVPARYVFLDSFPLTQNGKVDRKAFPAPAQRRAAAELAATGTQAKLAELWCELLEVQSVGLHEDVFDLGAHSLMAVQAVARIRSLFRADFQLRNLFENPTLAAQAQAIDQLAWAALAPGASEAQEAREEAEF